MKPQRRDELAEVIERFWRGVDVEKCQKYIRHLRKVIPKVIEDNGEATDF